MSAMFIMVPAVLNDEPCVFCIDVIYGERDRKN